MGLHNRWLPLHCGVILVTLVLALGLVAIAADPAPTADPIHDDAVLTGKEIIQFKDGPAAGWIVNGAFRLTLGQPKLGQRIISGSDAVIWVRDYTVGPAERHDVVLYVEGGAKIDEPGGLTTEDKVFLATFHNQGSITVQGPKPVQRDVSGMPLYARALVARKQAAAREKTLVRNDAPKPEPVLIRKKTPASVAGDSPPKVEVPTTTQPADETPPTGPAPVFFHADKFGSSVTGEGGRRLTVARGHVYLAQGAPESDQFIELRANDAVVVSRPLQEGEKAPAKDSHHPGTARMGQSAREVIVGVYLQGDVTISRGARFLRGPKAYYDFNSDRAILPNAVFRTEQEQRNIPVYIRADEIRMLSSREMTFRNARVSSSDFYTPTYHLGARRMYMMDTAPYDEKGKRLSETRWLTKLEHSTFSVRGVPLLYWPYMRTEVERGNTALRRASVGFDSSKGFGVETQWHLFRLMGLIEPEGVDAYLNLNFYEREPTVGIEYEYERDNYTGYGIVSGSYNRDEQDDFGDERKDLETRPSRGRVLLRHKHVLPDDWQAQFELSYLCDRNYLEAEYPDEFEAGKEQETLIYARKQRDNWVLTSLLQARLNRFHTQTESFPEVAFHLIGQPLWQDRLTYFSESRIGAKRWRPSNQIKTEEDSDIFARLDTRNELNLPLRIGPANVVPYVTTRLTYWGDHPDGGENFRSSLSAGVKANTLAWAVHNDVHSRFWDVKTLRHEIRPEVIAFAGTTGGWDVDDAYPMDPDIETHAGRLSGVSLGVHQRLQTKRGGTKDRPPTVVDWMRLSVVGTFYSTKTHQPPADGRQFHSRPENSIGSNHINIDYAWNISDSTTLLADMNIDVDDAEIGRSGIALAVSRDPRLKYFFGLRTIRQLDSILGTFGVKYKINRKYTVTFLEQYDFDFEGGQNNITQISLIRKLPRWYVAFTVQFDQRQSDTSFMLTIWPEGIPETQIRSSRIKPFATSDKN